MFNSLKHAVIAVHLCSASLVSIPALSQPLFTCLPLSGKVRLNPDPDCKIATLNPGHAYLGPMGIPNSCFSIKLSSPVLIATGNAGLTTETMISPIGGVAQTPAMLNEAGVPSTPNEFGIPETRRVYTGRAVLFLPGGKVFTAETGVLQGEEVTEQLTIVGGDGIYTNAKGVFHNYGKIIGQWGNFSGQLCIQR